MLYELYCQYDTRNSFYGKAVVRVEENENVLHLELLSYGTLVANYVKYKKENREVFEYFGKYSQTTTRHQKEFFKQNGLSDKEIKDLFKNGTLEVLDNED